MNSIDRLREVMGTGAMVPEHEETKFVYGVNGITVKMIDWPNNPYRAMYVMATSCWGDKIDKWEKTEAEYRFEVVKAVLRKEALPLAAEAPKFTFVVEGPSRAAFDQIARARLGVVFSAKGMRDNNWSTCGIRIPNWLKMKAPGIVEDKMREVKKLYHSLVKKDKGTWQAARAVLPLSVVYGWSMSINYLALANLCSARMKFCEQEDTVATAWLLADAVRKRFPLLGQYLRPGCDFSGKCSYHKQYGFSELFGCLFKECGRNNCESYSNYHIFNMACSDSKLIGKQLGIKIPTPKEFKENETVYYRDLSGKDKVLFEDVTSTMIVREVPKL